MLFVDVNVLIYAHRPESPDHARYLQWLEQARLSEELLGLGDTVLSGFVRIVTSHRIFKDPSPVDVALNFVRQLQTAPSSIRAEPTSNVWDIFAGLVTDVGATGNAIPDAFLAATAIDLSATMITADKGFARFPQLRWQHPLAPG